MMVRLAVGLSLCTAFFVGGCGGDEGDDQERSASPGGGSPQTATGSARPGEAPSEATVLASCRERCEAEAAGGCVFGDDEGLCISLCDSLIPLFDARCLAIKQAAQECVLAQDDVCDSGCGEEQSASNTCDADAI